MSIAREIAATCDSAYAAAAAICLAIEDRCPELATGSDAWWVQARLMAGAVAVCWADAQQAHGEDNSAALSASLIEAALAQAIMPGRGR